MRAAHGKGVERCGVRRLLGIGFFLPVERAVDLSASRMSPGFVVRFRVRVPIPVSAEMLALF